MDIRNLALDQIMQLPDHFFGRRWPLHFGDVTSPGGTVRGMIDAPLPERIVIWEIAILAIPSSDSGSYLDLRLGDHEPANQAEFWAFESVFGSQIDNAVYPGTFMISNLGAYRFTMRHPIATMGRRFVVEMRNGGAGGGSVSAVFVISSIPREIPDCLLNSEYLRSR